MDPVTAMGLAASILTFIDFAGKIVAGTYEIYQSAAGVTEENAHFDTIASDLTEITDSLDTIVPGKTKHEIALRDLASKCKVTANKLHTLLYSLRVSGDRTTWKSLKVKIKSMRKEPEIANLEKQLGDYRAQILTHLTVILSQDQSSIKSQLDRLEDTAVNFSSETAAQLAILRQNILEDAKQLAGDSARTSNSMTTQVRDEMWELRRSLETLSSRVKVLPRENAILRNLYFPSMDLREEGISNPEEGTFSWVLEEQKEGEIAEPEEGMLQEIPEEAKKEEERRVENRIIFLSWLQTGGGIFHISGKAGSGKSTLMKFLCHHRRTEEELGKWAANRGKSLVLASFYFWNSGDSMQMSLDGLHRSILFETLKRCPELIPVVFLAQWRGLGSDMFYVPGRLFTSANITEAFEMLAEHGTLPKHCFCFFIDGLDEYDGDSRDHVLLAKRLQRWASKEDVKICVSSRPYLEFDNLGVKDQKFHLHELTRHDIYLFTRQSIERDDNFGQIKESYLDLVRRIVRRSEGVFLWARLVVLSLLAGMLRHDTAKVLEERLNVVPQDINTLYNRILDSLDSYDRKRAIKMLLMTAHYPFHDIPLNCLTYGWVDELDDPSFPPCDGETPTSWRPASTMVDDVQRQLKGLTKGLLETAEFPRKDEWKSEVLNCPRLVQFSHRTVKDFVVGRLSSENTNGQYQNLFEEESYYRMILADLTLGTHNYRRVYCNTYIVSEVDRPLFRQKLPLTLLDGFSRLLNSVRDDLFIMRITGRTMGFGPGQSGPGFSFVHMAAYAGQDEYVLREISRQPELLKVQANGELHILLSASLAINTDLVSALIAKGSCPADLIMVRKRDTDEVEAVPIWAALLFCFAGHQIPSDRFYDILEFMLRATGVDARGCGFMLGGYVDSQRQTTLKQYITLEEVIRTIEPPNMERLLCLLSKSKQTSYVEGMKRFVSRFIPLFKLVEDPKPSTTNLLTFVHPRRSDSDPWICSVVYDGKDLSDFYVRVF